MKMLNTLRIVPTQDGYLVIQEQVSELCLTPDDVTCHVGSYDLHWKLRNLLDTQPEGDNNAAE